MRFQAMANAIGLRLLQLQVAGHMLETSQYLVPIKLPYINGNKRHIKQPAYREMTTIKG